MPQTILGGGEVSMGRSAYVVLPLRLCGGLKETKGVALIRRCDLVEGSVSLWRQVLGSHMLKLCPV